MDSAVWITQSLVDGRRSDREADAVAHRLARDARRSRAGGRHWVPSRRHRADVIPAAPAVEVAGPLDAVVGSFETAGDGRELAAAGDRR